MLIFLDEKSTLPHDEGCCGRSQGCQSIASSRLFHRRWQIYRNPACLLGRRRTPFNAPALSHAPARFWSECRPTVWPKLAQSCIVLLLLFLLLLLLLLFFFVTSRTSRLWLRMFVLCWLVPVLKMPQWAWDVCTMITRQLDVELISRSFKVQRVYIMFKIFLRFWFCSHSKLHRRQFCPTSMNSHRGSVKEV